MVQPLYEGSTPSPTAPQLAVNSLQLETENCELGIKECWVVKLADTPPCLGGGDHGTNAVYGLTTN